MGKTSMTPEEEAKQRFSDICVAIVVDELKRTGKPLTYNWERLSRTVDFNVNYEVKDGVLILKENTPTPAVSTTRVRKIKRKSK